MNRVVETYRAVFGADPEGVWSAPGRVNLIGEHTDYNDGLVLPIALPQRTYAACSPGVDGLLRAHSAQTGETVEVRLAEVGPGTPSGWTAYVAGVMWALAADGHDVGGLDVAVDSEVPLGGGLSSSAALECSVGAAVSDLCGLGLLGLGGGLSSSAALECSVGAAVSDLCGLGLLGDETGRARLAAACVRAENEVAGAPTGGMDQSASLLCREGHALLLDCRSGSTDHVPLDLRGPEGDGFVLLVTDTRAEHALNDGQYAQRRTACERAAAELEVESLRDVDPRDLDGALRRLSDDELRRRARHVVTEIERVRDVVDRLRAGDLGAVGRLFDASHASLRDDYEVSCAELDVSVEAARSAGALGARMTGGGFGGSSIALVPSGAVTDAELAVREAFAEREWPEPECFAVTPGAAAHRDS